MEYTSAQPTNKEVIEAAQTLIVGIGEHLLEADRIGCEHIKLWVAITLAMVGWDRLDLIQAMDDLSSDATEDD